jgi:hypothetical protein
LSLPRNVMKQSNSVPLLAVRESDSADRYQRVVERFLSSTSSYQHPARLVSPISWVEHIPFAFYLVDLLRPSLFVELGVHSGNSFCGFCQAIDFLNSPCKAYGIDSWEGDPHAGVYCDAILAKLDRYVDRHYHHFAQLLKMTFDEGRCRFTDGSIDLLHIDGYHSYEAAKHDFSTWLPKMSNRGVVVLHDTFVRRGDFGVWKLLDELSRDYTVLNVNYGFGLAMVLVGEDVPGDLVDFVEICRERPLLLTVFESLGRGVRYRAECSNLRAELDQRETPPKTPSPAVPNNEVCVRAVVITEDGVRQTRSFPAVPAYGQQAPFFVGLEEGMCIEKVILSVGRGPGALCVYDLALRDIDGSTIAGVNLGSAHPPHGATFFSSGPLEESIVIVLPEPMEVAAVSGSLAVIDGSVRPEFNHVASLVRERIALEREVENAHRTSAQLSSALSELRSQIEAHGNRVAGELEELRSLRGVGAVPQMQRPMLLLLSELSKIGPQMEAHRRVLEETSTQELRAMEERVKKLQTRFEEVEAELLRVSRVRDQVETLNIALADEKRDLERRCEELEASFRTPQEGVVKDQSGSTVPDPSEPARGKVTSKLTRLARLFVQP